MSDRTDATQDYYKVDWDKFGQIVIERWQKKMSAKGIFDTGTLYRSIEYGYRTQNAMNQTVGRGDNGRQAVTVPSQFHFSFPLYGIYVEAGVGRGYTRGNKGIERFAEGGRTRQRRTWYYRIFVNQRHKLGELVGEAFGRAAQHAIHTIEIHSIATPKNRYK